ncbi:uncharacterized protein EV422DRAFT_160479 [Fimicolochytrium jonesii]|uniref:uncharacterized protein n=1 Tax=Fimicolochytrium jonesii TaxID=1396493 RepID=UPI0022FDB1F2|nr:uncharacterized protein EV422DRAFT_160479 [Fimicolochytrium jonesii]KAI8826268.1 hypothetical protein EV422DRAFT_160479 [Fimicolochytrium jonesii]
MLDQSLYLVAVSWGLENTTTSGSKVHGKKYLLFRRLRLTRKVRPSRVGPKKGRVRGRSTRNSFPEIVITGDKSVSMLAGSSPVEYSYGPTGRSSKVTPGRGTSMMLIRADPATTLTSLRLRVNPSCSKFVKFSRRRQHGNTGQRENMSKLRTNSPRHISRNIKFLVDILPGILKRSDPPTRQLSSSGKILIAFCTDRVAPIGTVPLID